METNNKKAEIPAIEFRNVFLGFEERDVLVDLSFTLNHGEMIFITGESGSGKSVLLKLAMGLIKSDEGEIFVEGREIEMLCEDALLDIRGNSMGIVFQEDSLFSGLSVFDNVAYRLDEHNWRDEDIEKAVREILWFVGLEDFEDELPEELSGGMKRRLEIARAIVGWPRIMLFDEPTQGLDPVTATQILNLVLRSRDLLGISSIYVTKKMHEIEYLSSFIAKTDETGEVVYEEGKSKTNVILLKKGEKFFEGSSKEFFSSREPDVLNMTHISDETELSNYYTPDPWDKTRRPKERILY